MKKQVHSLLLFFILITTTALQAQTAKIPLMRQAFHDKVDDAQKKLLKLDGTADDKLDIVDDDDDMNLQLTYTVTKRIDAIQAAIEADTDDSNSKIKYLRALTETLESFLRNYRYQTMQIDQLPVLITAFSNGMQLDKQKASIVDLVSSQPFDIDNVLLKTVLFEDNATLQEAKNVLFLKDCRLHPDKILPSLNKNSDFPFTDSLISFSARYDGDELYTYAAASNKLGNKIRNSPDTLVQIISKLSRLKAGRQYFPFLDNLYHGKVTLEQIDNVMDDPLQYYRLLVSTKIDYSKTNVTARYGNGYWFYG